MNYRVACKPNSNALQSAMRFDLELEFELLEATESEETYEVRSERNIEPALDQSAGVIRYEKF